MRKKGAGNQRSSEEDMHRLHITISSWRTDIRASADRFFECILHLHLLAIILWDSEGNVIRKKGKWEGTREKSSCPIIYFYSISGVYLFLSFFLSIYLSIYIYIYLSISLSIYIYITTHTSLLHFGVYWQEKSDYGDGWAARLHH